VPDEISQDHKTTISLRINSTGMRDITALSNVTLVHPDTCTIDSGSISDNGDYDAPSRTINWSDLGALAIGNYKDVSFDITCNSSGAISFNTTSFYSDLVGELSTNAPATANVIDITDYITTVWSPSLIEPDGSSTLTVSIENPYGLGAIGSIVITPGTPLNWTKNPTSQSIASIALSSSDSRQFLVNVNSTVAYYNITTNISFTDPNGVSVLVNVTDQIQVASSPSLVIVREMAPVIGNSGEDVEVRFFIYNNGNDAAKNVNFTEYVNDTFWDGSGDVVSVKDGGTSNAAADIINWSIGDINKSDYALVRYIIEYNGAVTLESPTIYELAGDTAGWPYDFSACNGGDACINTTGTSYGISGQVDGWDNSSDQSPYDFGDTGSCIWGTVVANNRLRTEDSNTGTEILASCSYGIDVDITDEMYETIQRGGSVNISFNHRFWETVGAPTETEDQFWIKARWHSPTSGEHYLGSDQDTGMSGADNTLEVFTTCDDPGSCGGGVYGPTDFTQDITSWIEGSGNYYFDLGHKSQISTSNEDGRAEFDDINMIISGPKNYYFSSQANYSDASGTPLQATDNVTMGVRSNWGSLAFNLTKRVFNVSETFNTTLESLNIGGAATDDDPTLKLATTTNYYDSESPSSYASGTRTITFTEGSIASSSQVDNWFIINSTVADYHVLNAHGLSSSEFSEKLFVLSRSGELVLNITQPPENQVIYQGDFFNVTTNSTSINGNLVGCTLTLLPPGFAVVNGTSSASLGVLTPSTSEETVFNLTAANRGYDSVLVSGSCTAGTGDQDTVVINATYAIRMNSLILSESEIEAGDTLYNITVNSTNLGKITHDIVTTIDIFNSAGTEQDFGPTDSESITNSSITTNTDAIAVFTNSSSGYVIPSDQPTGFYNVNASSKPDSYDSRWINTTLRIVRVDVTNTLNTTSAEPGDTVQLSVNISNGWTSAVNYEVDVNVTYVPTSEIVTDDWSYSPVFRRQKA